MPTRTCIGVRTSGVGNTAVEAGDSVPGDPVKMKQLLNNPIRVVNIGLKSFAKDLQERGVPVVHVAWRPTAGANSKLAKLLSKLGN